MRFLALISIFLIGNNSLGAVFDEKIVSFNKCGSEAEAISCKSCINESGISLSFKVNASAQTVIQHMYENKKLVLAESLGTCKIADRQNWICGERIGLKVGGYIYNKHGMVNGVYFRIFESYSPPFEVGKLIEPSKYENSFYCAK